MDVRLGNSAGAAETARQARPAGGEPPPPGPNGPPPPRDGGSGKVGGPEAELKALASFVRAVQDQASGAGAASSDWGQSMRNALDALSQFVTQTVSNGFPDDQARQSFVTEVSSLVDGTSTWASQAAGSLDSLRGRSSESAQAVLDRTGSLLTDVRRQTGDIRAQLDAVRRSADAQAEVDAAADAATNTVMSLNLYT